MTIDFIPMKSVIKIKYSTWGNGALVMIIKYNHDILPANYTHSLCYLCYIVVWHRLMLPRSYWVKEFRKIGVRMERPGYSQIGRPIFHRISYVIKTLKHIETLHIHFNASLVLKNTTPNESYDRWETISQQQQQCKINNLFSSVKWTPVPIIARGNTHRNIDTGKNGRHNTGHKYMFLKKQQKKTTTTTTKTTTTKHRVFIHILILIGQINNKH